MLLRSLKLFHFRGVADLPVRDLPDGVAHGVPVPPGAEPRVVSEALRFAFLGDVPGGASPISDGAGYTWVEAAFRTEDGALASLFRGVDRRGVWQVSLREDAGMRITSGADDVAARLEELVGAPLARFERATFALADADPLAGWATVPAAPAPAVAAVVPAAPPRDAAAVEDARRETHLAIDALRRALQIRTLQDRAADDHEALLALGRALRRERSDLSLGIAKLVADRERVRVRLRRANEYRDLLSQARIATARRPAAPARRSPPRWFEAALGACAAGLLAMLVIPATAEIARHDEVGRAVFGLGFVVASASYLWVASKRHGAGRFVTSVDAPEPVPSPAADDQAAIAALRARFSDLGDPEDPNLTEDLRSRLSRLDEEAAPLQTRLERLDDALSLLDVEAGRAARSLHRPMPPKDEGDQGLPPGLSLDEIQTQVAALGDQIHQACVERDALVAEGTPSAGEAAHHVETAFRRLGGLAGDEAAAAAVVARERVAADAVDTLPADADARAISQRLVAVADALAATPRAVLQPATEMTTVALTPPLSGTSLDPARLDAVASPAVAAVTGGRYVRARAGADGALELEGPSGRAAWSSLEPAVRARVALAVRLRIGEDALREEGATAPRSLVLDARPDGFASDAELAQFAAEHAPRVTQVLYGVKGDAPPASAARRPDRRRR